MKTKLFFSLILMMAVTFFMSLCFAEEGEHHEGGHGGGTYHGGGNHGGGNHGGGNGGEQHRNYGGDRFKGDSDRHFGEHQGHEGDEGEFNWGLYYRHNNGEFFPYTDYGYTYQGPYGEYGDIFVFTDPDGREYDLYIRHQDRYGRNYGLTPLIEGDAYDFDVISARMYPRPDELKLGVRLNFRWGSLSLHNNRYYDMYSSPDLVNIRGRLYIRE